MAKLVAIGDSLTQGFHSFAITNTHQSFPAVVARSLNLGPEQFRLPDFRGRGGLPCSVEWLARRLEERFGAHMSVFDWLRALHAVPELLDEVEEYWERGKGSRPGPDLLFHNLAVWGFEAGDAFGITAQACEERIGRSTNGLLAIPSHARPRTALRVLNPARSQMRQGETQISAAMKIKEADGRIEHLIVWMGANNCLGTVVDLEIRETEDRPPGPFSGCTLWKPRAFEADYDHLAEGIASIGADHVYVATVPHVTIPPITRGVMKNRGVLPEDRKYYDYYGRFFILDKDFDPDRDKYLSGAQAEYIDKTIDQYNAVIRRNARERGWNVVDICAVLDQLAVRRNHGKPSYPLPPALSDLSIRFFETGPGGELANGGLIGLDGVHPTPTGYGIVAHEFLQEIAKFEPNARPIDFEEVRASDALVTRPPRTLDDIFGALGTLERHFHLSRWISPGQMTG